ncbi:MAG: hypothetical protein DRG78_15225 [Epsilonproteobacteria bacterium]|nr:MAG: hypothetical protein DRG78_15225 [Campylobacterota bacterium]
MPNVVSIQTGEQTTSGSTTPYNITISSVVTSHSIVLVSCRAGQYTNSYYENKYMWTGTLTSSTNLQIASASSITATMYVRWQVIEFDSNTSVQRGEQSILSSAQLSTISAVDLSKTWGISYLHASSDPFTGPMTIAPRGRFHSNTTYQCNTHSAYSYTAIHSWQVIEQTDISVEHLDYSVLNEVTAADDFTINQVDADKSFIIAGWNPDNSTPLNSVIWNANMIRQYRFEPNTSTTTKIRTSGFQPYPSGMQMHFSAMIITSPSGIISAQQNAVYFEGYIGPPNAVKTLDQSITSVNTNASMVLLNGTHQSWMPMNGNSEECSCDFAFTGNLTSSTNIRLQRHDRESSYVNAAYSWCYYKIVEFGTEEIPIPEAGRRKQVFVT